MSAEMPTSEQASTTQSDSNDVLRSDRKSSLTRAMKTNLVVSSAIGLLCAVNLDGGTLFQVWYFAMAAYWSATLLIWSVHRKNLSRLDVFVARWGFLMAFFTVPFLSALFWWLYGGGAPLRDWFLS